MPAEETNERGRRGAPSRTKHLDLPSGSAAAAAAREAIDALAREVGDLHADTRLLVSELVTASVRHFGDAGAPDLGISISAQTVRVELCYPRAEGTENAGALEPDQWGHMLLDVLASRWGIGDGERPSIWFELDRR